MTTPSLGLSVPHRSLDPIDPDDVIAVARAAEEQGFADVWVTNNALDSSADCLDSLGVLNFVAAQTERVGLGVSVLVLPIYHPIHVAHGVASLDWLSGGRAMLGLGLGREGELEEFGVSTERRVGRFLEQVAIIKGLWSEGPLTHAGEAYRLQDAEIRLKPRQEPHPPIWFGGVHPNAIRRAVRHADAWMGAGGASTESFEQAVGLLEQALADEGRSPDSFTISKRVFLSVHPDEAVAREEVRRWYGEVYGSADHAEVSAAYGTVEAVREQLHAIVDAGADHVLLNPICRYREHIDLIADVASDWLGQGVA